MTQALLKFPWGSRIEIERRIRMRLCLAAFAYETCEPLLATDAEFDALALQSNVSISTGKHDEWWRANFVPYTGSWIHTHPDINGIEKAYERVR